MRVYCSSLLLVVGLLLLVACSAPLPAPVVVVAPTASASPTALVPAVVTPLVTITPTAPISTAAPALSSGIEPAWRTELAGIVNWAPALLTAADGQVLLIAASEADAVTALDPASGAVLWQFTPPGRLWTDSVTVLGDAVFLASEGALVTLLDGATGAVRWQRSIQPAQGAALAGLEARGRPVLADGVIYVPSAGVGSRAPVSNPALQAPLLALDWATGNELWRFESDGYLLRAPYVDETMDTVYVGGNAVAGDDVDEGGLLRIYALNRADGSLRWVQESHDGLIKSLWASQDRLAYVAYRDFVVGLDSASGTEVYRHNTGNWVQSFTPFPALLAPSGLPRLAYGSANAFLNLIDPENGDFVWRYNIEGTFNYPIGNAALAGNVVYFISQRGDLHALAAEDGRLLWRTATGLETRDGIAVGAGHIFVGSVDGAIHAFRLQ